MKAIVPGAKECGGFDFILARIEELDDLLKPVEGGDLAEFINRSLRQFESELPGLGLPGGVSGDRREVDL